MPSNDSIGIKVFMPSLYFATHLLPSIPMSAPFSFTYSRLTYSSPFHRFVTIKLRPLTGFLIAKLTSHFLIERLPFFIPSPLGASYFQISLIIIKAKDLYNGFRPLSGHLISKSQTPSGISFSGFMFPPPLGASYFQIVIAAIIKFLFFRKVSVPSRGILFPNH